MPRNGSRLLGPLAVWGMSFWMIAWLLAAPSYALSKSNRSWSEKAMQNIERFNREDRIEKPLVSTSWGYFRFINEKLSPLLGERGLVKIQTRESEHHLPYHYFKRFASQDPIVSTAPLMIILPGLFSEPDADLYRTLQKVVNEKEYHSLVLPNAWALSVLRASPELLHATPHQQASYLAQLAVAALKVMDQKRIEHVEILSVSHGAFLTPAFVRAFHRKTAQKIKRATLLSPPIRISDAARNLDAVIDEKEIDYLSGDCDRLLNSTGKLFKLFIGFLKISWSRGENNFFYECAPTLTLKIGFLDGLESLFSYWKKTGKSTEALSELRFYSFLKQVNPFYLDHERWASPYSLATFLNQAAIDSPETHFRTILSDDDFLNAGINIDEFEKNLKIRGQLLRLGWGGHLGYFGSKSFLRAFAQLLEQK
jgi:predicted alpha/beta-fold hydrolase